MNVLYFLFLAVLAILCVSCVPIIAIWAVNTLFATHIAYSLINWFAALLLICIVGR